jgi:hypothetical protein
MWGRKVALKLFNKCNRKVFCQIPISFVGVLNACASVLALTEGRLTHKQNIESDFKSNVFVRSSLVDIYAKHGRMEEGLEGVQQDAIT